MAGQTESNPNVTPGRSHSGAWLGWLLPVGFGVLAVALLAGSDGGGLAVEPVRAVERASLEVGPTREAMADPAHIVVGGVAQGCNGCHQIFRSASSAGAALSYHTEIHLGHGMNDRCVNCHDVEDRERLALRDGTTVTFAETARVCAQCHGTVYRDWQRGTHGKTLGSWVTGSASQRRLRCNECHDPHSPRFDPVAPLPGPNTLRMGEQGSGGPRHDDGGRGSPLQRWLRDLHASPPGAPAHEGDHR